MLDGMGVGTSADFDEILGVAGDVADRLDLGLPSHVLRGGTVADVLAATSGGD